MGGKEQKRNDRGGVYREMCLGVKGKGKGSKDVGEEV